MTFDNTDDAYKLLEDAGVPVCPVLTAQQVWTNEEFQRLGWWHEFPMYEEWKDDPNVASNKHCIYFADFSSVEEHPETRVARPAPRVGEQSYEILSDWGLSHDEARELLTKWGANNT